MIHYSCDRCHRRIKSEDVRYTVRLEIQVAMDPLDSEPDDDRDHLGELQEILEGLDEEECEEISQSAYQQRLFDLCSDCHRQYVKNPLAREPAANLEFSDN